MRARKVSYYLTAMTAVVVALFGCSCVSVEVAKNDLLPPKTYYYDQIHFEIAAVTSATPAVSALRQFRERLHENQICRRRNITFSVHAKEYPATPDNLWTADLLHSFEYVLRRDRDLDRNDRNLTIFIAYVEGIWVKDGVGRRVAGLAYSLNSFAVFKDRSESRESTVLLHEFGHLIGIMRDYYEHHDEDHPNHCKNRECAMYWTAARPGGDYGADCKAELLRQIRKRDKQ